MKKLTASILAPVAALILGSPAFAAETQVKRVDINNASAEQLKALPGIGEADAQKIIDARPYLKKDDLKNVIPADQFEKIQRLIDSVC